MKVHYGDILSKWKYKIEYDGESVFFFLQRVWRFTASISAYVGSIVFLYMYKVNTMAYYSAPW